jgi:sirohydrochlorin ferrochelatase
LLLIGRGSRDEEATAQMHRLGEILHGRLGLGATRTGFIAMAEPTADDLIAWAAAGSLSHIIVQPHLLLHGELLDGLQQNVIRAAAEFPHKSWRFGRILGEERGTKGLAQVFARLVKVTAESFCNTNITTQ